MSIEDRLLSAGNAWRESQPPVTAVADVRRKPARWLPLTAAAATVAVVVGASLLVSRDDSPAPVASGIVPWAELKFTEADVPAPRLPEFDSVAPPIAQCGADQVRGTVARLARSGSDVTGRIELRATTACAIGSGNPVLSFTGPTDGLVGPRSRFEGHAAAVTPPARPSLMVSDASPVAIPFRWTGSNCVPADLLRIEGLDALPGVYFVAIDKASFAPCDTSAPSADGELVAGIPHQAGQPAARLPEGRDALRVFLELPQQLDTDDFRYVVSLANPTARDIPLSPCPTYAWSLTSHPKTPPGGYPTPDAGGGVLSPGFGTAGGGGRLNCDAAPDAVAAGQTVRFEMRIPPELTIKNTATAKVTWAIAGPATAVSDVPAQPTDSNGPVEPSTGSGTTTSLRADLDDDGRPDLATVNATTGVVVVITAAGELPALQVSPAVNPEAQGVLDLPGPDGLLISTTSPGASAAQRAVVMRVVDGRLVHLRYSDGDREPLELLFNNGRGDQWAGVRCTATGLRVLRAALETSNTDTVVFREQDLSLGPDGMGRGEVRVTGVPTPSTGEAISTAAQLAATSCAGLTARGISRGERSVTHAR